MLSWFVGELGAAYAVASHTAHAERIPEDLVARANASYLSISLVPIALMLERVDEALQYIGRAPGTIQCS
jgi:hypothetical protein